jgi:glutathione S-transferase
METELERNGEWVTGQFSLADIAVAPYLFRLSRLAVIDFGPRRFDSE